MAVRKLSEITPSGAAPVAADTVIGVHAGTTDVQFTFGQVASYVYSVVPPSPWDIAPIHVSSPVDSVFIGLFSGPSAAIRFGSDATGRGLLHAVDQTGVGSYKDLTLGGVNVRIQCAGTTDAFLVGADSAVYFPGITTTVLAPNAYLDTTASNKILISTSSLRYKTDVRKLGLDQVLPVLNIDPIQFRSLASADDPDREFVGLAAEDVASKLPQFVNFDKLGRPDGVQYDRLAAVALLAVVKDQQRRIDVLEREMRLLRDGRQLS